MHTHGHTSKTQKWSSTMKERKKERKKGKGKITEKNEVKERER